MLTEKTVSSYLLFYQIFEIVRETHFLITNQE